MMIGEQLRVLRELKNLSQGDIETRTGLLRCYISRVENGHTVPSVETLEKFARALETPLYSIFHLAENNPAVRRAPRSASARQVDRILERLAQVKPEHRDVLLSFAKVLAARHK